MNSQFAKISQKSVRALIIINRSNDIKLKLVVITIEYPKFFGYSMVITKSEKEDGPSNRSPNHR